MNRSALQLAFTALMSAALISGCASDGHNMMDPGDSEVSIAIDPPDGTTEIGLDAVIRLRFDRAMSRAVESNFSLHTGWGVGSLPVPGTFVWSGDSMRCTFQPASPLRPEQTYTVRLMGMMRGGDGRMHRPHHDTTGMGGMPGMGTGMMMGGVSDDEIRTVCSTGPMIRKVLDLDLSTDVVLVCDGGSGDIAVIDPVLNRLTALQPLVSVRYLHHLYLSPDRRTLYISDAGTDIIGSGGHGGHGGTITSRVILLDSRTLLEARRLTVSGVVHNAVPTTDGSGLLFANANTGTVLRYALPSLTLLSTYAVGREPLEVTITPDGRWALVANSGDATLARVAIMGDGSITRVSVGATPVGAWISHSGSAWVTSEGSRSASLVSVEPLTVATTLPLGFTPGQAFVHPTRGELYVANEDAGQVHIYDTTTLSPLATIQAGAGAHGITFSSDGSKAWVSNERAHSVTVIDCPSRTAVTTIPVGLAPNGILYRPAI